MTFKEYQKEAVSFRTETASNEEYLKLGLMAEVGEAAGKLAKRRRDGVFDEKAFIKELGDILWFVANLADYYDRERDANFSKRLLKCFERIEVSEALIEACTMCQLAYWVAWLLDGTIAPFMDIMVEVACLAKTYGYTLEQVAEINLEKLRDRAARGKIQGNGDESLKVIKLSAGMV